MRTSLGLIGHPLGHSFSPAWFRDRFRDEGLQGWTYDLFPLERIADLPRFLSAHRNLLGFNVTLPHKQAIMEFLDELDPYADRTGAVNTVAVLEDGRLKGWNTDAPAFREVLLGIVGPYLPEHALVLGSGGAAAAVRVVLEDLAIPYLTVSRTKGRGDLTYPDLDQHRLIESTLIIQATPVGMTPASEACLPIPFEAFGPDHILIDLVYNPPRTRFLALGEAAGSTTENGLKMLYLQAEKSWQIWRQI